MLKQLGKLLSRLNGKSVPTQIQLNQRVDSLGNVRITATGDTRIIAN